MQTVRARVYNSKNEEKFIFPEIERKIVNLENPAICLSGGGSRSYIICIGVFRSLLQKIALKDISYICSVSGGTWFAAILLYAKFTLRELLGESVELINEENLLNTNFSDDCPFMGKCINNFPVVNLLSDSLRSVPTHFVPQHVLKKVFLDNYNLSGKVPVLSKKMIKFNKKYNKVKSITPRPESPFWISQSSVLHSSTARPFTHSSLYSGCPVKTEKYGGNYVQNQGVGFRKTEIKSNQVNKLQVRKYAADSCLESIIACSSSAHSILSTTSEIEILKRTARNLTPKINMWSEDHGNKYQFIADGAFFDNTGIISLCARGCKKIISIISSTGILLSDEHLCTNHLFGIKLDFTYDHLRKQNKIFHSSEWNEFRHSVMEKARNKTFVYYRKTLEVLPNPEAGVNGNYEVDLLIIYLEKVDEFEEKFEKGFDPEYLGNYPNYPLFFSTEDTILEMTRSQINVLSTYSDWYVSKILEIENYF